MSIDLYLPGTDLSNEFDDFTPPVVDGLVAWHFLGGSLAKSIKNWAPGGADALAVGSPVVADHSLDFKAGSDYIQTAIKQTSDMTLFVVGRPLTQMANSPFGGGAVFYSTYSGPRASDASKSSYGMTLTTSFYDNLQAAGLQSIVSGVNSDGSASGAFQQLLNEDLSVMKALCVQVSAGVQTIFDLTTGATVVAPNAATPLDIGTNPILLGSATNAFVGGQCRESIFAAYERAVSATEMAAIYANLKAIQALWGVAV